MSARGPKTRKKREAASPSAPPAASTPLAPRPGWRGPLTVFAAATLLGAVVTTAVAGRVSAQIVLDPTGGFSRPATDRALPAGEGRSLFERRCNTCHGLGLVLQQRLSAEAWAAEVKKMRGWGAFLSDDEAAIVTSFLAGQLGKDAPRAEPGLLDPHEAEVATRAESVPGPRGDAALGAELFKMNCAPCHGNGAEGARGPALRGRPIATQPFRFGAVVRAGRGDMPGYPTFDGAAMANLLAFVRAP